MKIICLGDSFTEGFLVNKNYTRFLKEAGFDVINLGINGNTTSQMKRRVPSEKSDVFIVFGGTNDFYSGQSVDLAYKNIKSILEKVKAREKLVIIPPLIEEDKTYPVYGYINRKINDLGERLIKDGLNIVDARKISPQFLDGTHMGENFHKDLARGIIEKLGELDD